MRECTSIFDLEKPAKRLQGRVVTRWVILLALLWIGLSLNKAMAAEKKEETGTDDILTGPYSEYGEFDSGEDEDADERFFQYGRFFGVGVGSGYTTATGNAGKLYQGNNPMIDLRLAYWFDFHWSLNLGVQNSTHNYNVKPDGLTDVNLFRTVLQVRYYFDTHNLSAPLTFIGPNIVGGVGFYQRTDNVGANAGDSTTANSIDTQNAFGLNVGAGLELTLKPKKVYLQLETLGHIIQFRDNLSPKFKSAGIPDRTGIWMAATVALMWTW